MKHAGRRPPRRLDGRAAEQLLRRDPAARHAHPGLAEILESAAAPGREDELTDRPAAVAAFRAGRTAGGRPPRRLPVRGGIARMLGLKAVAVFAAAAATGGVTLAAATGTLHVPADAPVTTVPSPSRPPRTAPPAGGPMIVPPRTASTPGAPPAPVRSSCAEAGRATGDAFQPPPGPQEQQGGQPAAGEPRPTREPKLGACGSTPAPADPPPAGPTFAGEQGPGNRPPGGGECRDHCPPRTGDPGSVGGADHAG
jgi:hypothetical protein